MGKQKQYQDAMKYMRTLHDYSYSYSYMHDEVQLAVIKQFAAKFGKVVEDGELSPTRTPSPDSSRSPSPVPVQARGRRSLRRRRRWLPHPMSRASRRQNLANCPST